jgi:hypothetical protein
VTRIRRSAIAAVLCLGLPLALPAAPAGSHSGGRAQLYVDTAHLEPQPTGWLAWLVVRDADSGRAEPGLSVQIAASGPGGASVGPVNLADPDADGRYAAVVPLTEGSWALTVQAAELPGGPRAIPFTKTWPAILRAGHPVDLSNSGATAMDRRTEDGVPAKPLALGLAAATAVAALGALARHRRALA